MRAPFLSRVFARASSRDAAPSVAKSATVPSPALPFLGSVGSNAGAVVNQSTALSVPAVIACVSIIAEDVARCAPGLWRIKPDGSRERAVDHPVARLLARPNRLQTWFEFAEQMTAALKMRGNAYAVILRDARGAPVELIPVNPDLVMVMETSDGEIYYNVARSGLFMIAVLRSLPQMIPASDIFHLRGLAFHPTVGVNRISVVRDTIGLAISQILQSAKWIANGALPSGVLKTAKRLSDDAAKRLASSWRAMFAGPDNVGAVAILEEGLDWTAMKLTAVDLEFIEQSKFTVEQIGRLFRMPPHKLGIVDALAKMNQAAADQDYVNNTIMPDCERWEQKFDATFDLSAQGLVVDLDETRLLRADAQTRLNIGRLGVLSGLMTPNEYRLSENLKPKPGGDELRAPVNLAALGSEVTGTAADGAGRPSSDHQDPAKDIHAS